MTTATMVIDENEAVFHSKWLRCRGYVLYIGQVVGTNLSSLPPSLPTHPLFRPPSYLPCPTTPPSRLGRDGHGTGPVPSHILEGGGGVLENIHVDDDESSTALVTQYFLLSLKEKR